MRFRFFGTISSCLLLIEEYENEIFLKASQFHFNLENFSFFN